MAYLCFYSAEGRGEGGEKVKQYLQLSCFQKGKRNRVHEKMRAEGSERGRGAEPSGAPAGTRPGGCEGPGSSGHREAVRSQHGAEHGRQGLPAAERAELTGACGALRAAGGAQRVCHRAGLYPSAHRCGMSVCAAVPVRTRCDTHMAASVCVCDPPVRGHAAGDGEWGDELRWPVGRAAKGRAWPQGAAPCEATAVNFSVCFSAVQQAFCSPAIRAELQGAEEALLLPPGERRALPEEPGAHP